MSPQDSVIKCSRVNASLACFASYGVWLCVALAVVVGPWFFGAWEMVWFWLFAGLLSLAILLQGIRMLVKSPVLLSSSLLVSPEIKIAFLTLPFLVYAVVRWAMTPVFMDAERSVLLHASGITVAVLTVFGMTAEGRRHLFMCLWCSLFAMAIYGIINHLFFESLYVLWMPRYEQYAGRATGPYYCPDHFAGAMELLVGMSFGMLLDRFQRGPLVRAVAFGGILLGFMGALFSQSRGAGMTLLVMAGGVLLWGFSAWPKQVRRAWHLLAVPLAAGVVMIGLALYPGYVERFITYGGLHEIQSESLSEGVEQVWERLRKTSRGRMYGGAFRAWQSAPWLGVGPGMHQHVWPAFAATQDGSVEEQRWPTMTNHTFHSYEVHSDWLELLQTYGILGFLLFLVPFLALWFTLLKKYRHLSMVGKSMGKMPVFTGEWGYTFCGILVVLGMAFHSLGDFNLQMPGTVWMLAALIGVALRPPDAK